MSSRKVLNPPSSSSEVSDPSSFALSLFELGSSLKTEFVTEKGLDYARLAASGLFLKYREQVGQLRQVDLGRLSEGERKAFFLNLYNLLTVHALAEQDAVPDRAVDVKGLWSDYCYEFCDGAVLSLDDLEHGLLRCNRAHPSTGRTCFHEGRRAPSWAGVGEFDCRIHFALNCGARSCPAVRFYQAKSLDSQLDKAARSFCSQEINITTDSDSKKVAKLSKIFEWYRGDFGASDTEFRNTLAGFVASSDPDKRDALLDPNCAIEFAAYDWSTNNDAA